MFWTESLGHPDHVFETTAESLNRAVSNANFRAAQLYRLTLPRLKASLRQNGLKRLVVPEQCSIGVFGPRDIDQSGAQALERMLERLHKRLHVQQIVTSGQSSGLDEVACEWAHKAGVKIHAVVPRDSSISLYPRIDTLQIVGQDWGDHYQTMLDLSDCLLYRVPAGPRTKPLIERARSLNKTCLSY